MGEKSLKDWYILYFLILIILLGAFESTIWKNLFETIPSPLLWLSVITYTCILRSPFECLILIYTSSFILQTMTVLPIGFLIFIETIILIFIKVFKNRIYWDGRSYFVFLNCIGILFFHLIHIFLSNIFEENPLTHIQPLNWIGEIIIFTLISPVMYTLLSFILPLGSSQLDDGVHING